MGVAPNKISSSSNKIINQILVICFAVIKAQMVISIYVKTIFCLLTDVPPESLSASGFIFTFFKSGSAVAFITLFI
jgi:hypothetical protein